MNLGSALKKSYAKAQKSVTKAIAAPPEIVLPNVDPALLDSSSDFGSVPVSQTYDSQLGDLSQKRLGLIDQRAGFTPPGSVEPKMDTRSLWIAGGLGLLGALLNKGNNGTRQSGMRAMQNILGGAQNTANRKAQMAAQKSMQDYNAQLAKNAAELEKNALQAATVNGRISADNAAAVARQKQANDDREYNLKVKQANETIRKNQANEEIAKYKASPQFVRDFDGLQQKFPHLPPNMVEAMLLAPFQYGMEKVFNIKANTADKKEQTRLRPIVEENRQNYLKAALEGTNNRYYAGLDQKDYQFDEAMNLKERELAVKQAQLQAEAVKKQASLHYTADGYPRYGGYDSRSQIIGALRNEADAISKRIEADRAATVDGEVKPSQTLGYLEKQALINRIAYLNEAMRKIVNGIPLGKDPWGVWIDPAKVKQTSYSPLLPTGTQNTSAPPFKPSLSGPIGR